MIRNFLNWFFRISDLFWLGLWSFWVIYDGIHASRKVAMWDAMFVTIFALCIARNQHRAEVKEVVMPDAVEVLP